MMASSQQQDPAKTSPAATVVGNAFVDQYYHLLHESPSLVHRFYQDISKLGRPEENGIMGITTTMDDINKKILSLSYDEFSVEIISVDAQESYGGAVLILVTGFMIGKDNMKQKFTQCFFLAPQKTGYFVLNDIFRYVDENENQGSFDDAESPVTPDNVADPSVQEVQVSEQIVVTAGNVNEEEVHYPQNGQASIEQEASLPVVIDENSEDSVNVPKNSYASIVMKESGTPTSTAKTAVRIAPKSQEHRRTAVPPPPAPSMSETNGFSENANENGNNQESEAEGYSIFVKGLPFNATPLLLDDVFKKFGPIKSDGIQVRTQKGFCFGFVEFEVASAVQSALEASPILINGRHAFVEEKKSTNKGNSRGRFPSGKDVGYRNEGPRGHRNYGNGRSYGRNDNSRSEFGYKNGNRGDNGYHSQSGNNHIGIRSGRNRTAGNGFGNSTARTMPARVPTPA